MTGYPDLFTQVYPDMPGHRGVDTSIAAAEGIAPVTARLQSLALTAIRAAGSGGLTTNELAERLDIVREAVQPRTSELRQMGKIRDSGQRRKNASGKSAIVWVAVEEGSANG